MKIRGRSLYHLYKEFRDHFLKNMRWNLNVTNGSGEWKIFFVITRFCHIKVLFHIYYYWGKENSLLYQGLCYIKVLYIDRGSTVVLNWNFF